MWRWFEVVLTFAVTLLVEILKCDHSHENKGVSF